MRTPHSGGFDSVYGGGDSVHDVGLAVGGVELGRGVLMRNYGMTAGEWVFFGLIVLILVVLLFGR